MSTTKPFIGCIDRSNSSEIVVEAKNKSSITVSVSMSNTVAMHRVNECITNKTEVVVTFEDAQNPIIRRTSDQIIVYSRKLGTLLDVEIQRWRNSALFELALFAAGPSPSQEMIQTGHKAFSCIFHDVNPLRFRSPTVPFFPSRELADALCDRPLSIEQEYIQLQESETTDDKFIQEYEQCRKHFDFHTKTGRIITRTLRTLIEWDFENKASVDMVDHFLERVKHNISTTKVTEYLASAGDILSACQQNAMEAEVLCRFLTSRTLVEVVYKNFPVEWHHVAVKNGDITVVTTVLEVGAGVWVTFVEACFAILEVTVMPQFQVEAVRRRRRNGRHGTSTAVGQKRLRTTVERILCGLSNEYLHGLPSAYARISYNLTCETAMTCAAVEARNSLVQAARECQMTDSGLGNKVVMIFPLYAERYGAGDRTGKWLVAQGCTRNWEKEASATMVADDEVEDFFRQITEKEEFLECIVVLDTERSATAETIFEDLVRSLPLSRGFTLCQSVAIAFSVEMLHHKSPATVACDPKVPVYAVGQFVHRDVPSEKCSSAAPSQALVWHVAQHGAVPPPNWPTESARIPLCFFNSCDMTVTAATELLARFSTVVIPPRNASNETCALVAQNFYEALYEGFSASSALAKAKLVTLKAEDSANYAFLDRFVLVGIDPLPGKQFLCTDRELLTAQKEAILRASATKTLLDLALLPEVTEVIRYAKQEKFSDMWRYTVYIVQPLPKNQKTIVAVTWESTHNAKHIGVPTQIWGGSKPRPAKCSFFTISNQDEKSVLQLLRSTAVLFLKLMTAPKRWNNRIDTSIGIGKDFRDDNTDLKAEFFSVSNGRSFEVTFQPPDRAEITVDKELERILTLNAGTKIIHFPDVNVFPTTQEEA